MSSFGQDAAGELYLVDYPAGAILRVAPLTLAFSNASAAF